ncbi:hypothetical protein BK659_09315 [Pseudomonas brassicacearum]|uniref:Uncharacterized protein n=1 Tax=Pseudomonas brassicacearum TaxID=930166 RepID=A0A423HA83_9PSED|nr:hypothetical protein [Pseudomonas brassicacearum]RON10091.1 hypothetical protein BK659_09315 [Pseudomonas brassicacearum]
MTAKQDLGKVSLNAFELAEQSRDQLRSWRMDDPIVQNDPPSIDGLLRGNLVPKSLLDNTNIKVMPIPYLNTPHLRDYYQVLLRKKGSSAEDIVEENDLGPVDATRDWPREVNLPSAKLVDAEISRFSTEYEVAVIVRNGDSDNPTPKVWLGIQVDRCSPYQNKQSGVFDNPVKATLVSPAPDAELDSQWLESNTEIKFSISTGYQFYDVVDDKVDVYFSKDYSQTAPSGFVTTLPLGNGQLSIPVAGLSLESETFYLYYRLRDLAGNDSWVSLDRSIVVNIYPDAVLTAPVVPLAIDGAIDLHDVQSRVFVEVKYPVNGRKNDQVTLYIVKGQAGATPLLVDTKELADRGDLQFEMFYHTHLKPVFGDSEIEVPAKVYYVYKRGNSTYPNQPETLFVVDFSVRGPATGELPDLTNKNMLRVTVEGESKTPNHITSEDRNGDVEEYTPMAKTDAGGDPEWTPMGDEEFELWLDGKLVKKDVLLGSETEIRSLVNPSLIDSIVPGANKMALWKIREGGGRNTLSSEPQPVQVDEVGIEFPEPKIPLNRFGDVNCESLGSMDYSLTVTVEFDPLLIPVGTDIIVESIGTTERDGTGEISSTAFSKSYKINGGEVGNKFEVVIEPYARCIKPIQPTLGSGKLSGCIKVWYLVGPNQTKSAVNMKIVKLLSDENYCEGTPIRK